MHVTFSAKTDVGRVRERNEDNFLIDKKLQLHVVCDGMGGHAAGAVASATAVNVAREHLLQHQEAIESYRSNSGVTDRHDLLRLLEETIQQACFKIYERAQRTPQERGMGTTLSLILFVRDRAFIGHVGDSRVYLLRDSNLHQLTDDHSLLADMVKHGRINSPQEVDPRFRNAVTRAVGVHETVDVDTLDLEVLPGDQFLLCSDGLTGYANAATLKEIIEAASDEEQACQALIDHANEQGGSDNITALLTTVQEVPDCQPQKLRHILDTLRGLALFQYLSYPELLRVLNIAEQIQLTEGELAFSQGDHGHCAYVILGGRIQIRVDDITIAVLEQGRHFGEMALVDDQPRSADAIAAENSWLLIVPRSAFYDIMRKNPMLAVKLLWSFLKALTIRLRRTTSELSLTKRLFSEVSPEEVTQMSTEWLPPDNLQYVRRPRRDSGLHRLGKQLDTPDSPGPPTVPEFPAVEASGVHEPPPEVPSETSEAWSHFDDGEEPE